MTDQSMILALEQLSVLTYEFSTEKQGGPKKLVTGDAFYGHIPSTVCLYPCMYQ
jgi:hypothetical protein